MFTGHASRTILLGGLLGMTSSIASPVLAQAPAYDAAGDDAFVPRPVTDPTLVTGIFDVTLGASLVTLGLLLSDEREAGTLVGAGIGTMAVGVPMIAAGAKPVSYARNDTATFAFGSALVSIGGTLTGTAAGYFVGDAIDRARSEGRARDAGDYALPAGTGAFGMAIAALGAGLMVAGSAEMSFEDWSHQTALRDEIRERQEKREHDAERARARRQRDDHDGLVPRSAARAAVGQVLVVFGGASLVCSIPASLMGLLVCAGRICPSSPTYVGGALLANALVAGGVGAPLWATGAKRVPEEAPEETTAWIPEVHLGAGSAAITMRF